jgi:hypothetical protein
LPCEFLAWEEFVSARFAALEKRWVSMAQNFTRRVDAPLDSWAASFFSPRQRQMLVFFRKESGGFAAADRLTRLGEMAKGFIILITL